MRSRTTLWIAALLLVGTGLMLAQPAVAQQKIVADDAAAGAFFGSPLQIAEGRLIVGAYADNDERGAVYVFAQQADGAWVQEAKLTADDGQPGDWLADALASDGTYVLAGAPNLDGDEGAVYVFMRDGSGWQQQARLTLDDDVARTSFGFRGMAMSGAVAVIGAGSDVASVWRREGETWVEEERLVPFDATNVVNYSGSIAFDGTYALIADNAADAPLDAQGAVYVHERAADGTWSNVTKLTAGDADEEDRFGIDVALCGEEAFVSATFEDERGDGAGAVYVFRRNADGSWTQTHKLMASDGAATDRFGTKITCRGRVAVIGAFGKDEGGENLGAAYLFRRSDDGTWQEQGRLRVDGLEAGDFFGFPVALSADEIYVGAIGDDEQGEDAGAVYVLPLPESTAADQAVPETPMSAPVAYPNPVTATTRLAFSLPQAAEVSVAVFDLLGRRVYDHPARRLVSGAHEVRLDLAGHPAGVYLYRVQMQSGGHTTAQTGQIVLR